MIFDYLNPRLPSLPKDSNLLPGGVIAPCLIIVIPDKILLSLFNAKYSLVPCLVLCYLWPGLRHVNKHKTFPACKPAPFSLTRRAWIGSLQDAQLITGLKEPSCCRDGTSIVPSAPPPRLSFLLLCAPPEQRSDQAGAGHRAMRTDGQSGMGSQMPVSACEGRGREAELTSRIQWLSALPSASSATRGKIQTGKSSPARLKKGKSNSAFTLSGAKYASGPRRIKEANSV